MNATPHFRRIDDACPGRIASVVLADERYSAHARGAYVLLCVRADADRVVGTLAPGELDERLGVDADRATMALHELVVAGLLSIEPRFDPGGVHPLANDLRLLDGPLVGAPGVWIDPLPPHRTALDVLRERMGRAGPVAGPVADNVVHLRPRRER